MEIIAAYDRLARTVSARLPEGVSLLFMRIAIAGVFWRSGRTKVEEGSWFQISDTTYFLFQSEYAQVPLPSDFAALAATAAEHLFPVLLLLGLGTRFASLSLLVMTMVIQIFVYPEAWWATHMLWAAMLLMLFVRGAGVVSLDHAIAKKMQCEA